MREKYLEPNSGSFLAGLLTKPNHTQVVSADATLDATDVGSVHLVQAADKTSTLPATVAGMVFTFVLDLDLAATETFAVDLNASDKLLGGCGFSAGGDGKKITITGGKKGDFIQLIADGTDGWNIAGISSKGIWAIES